MAPYTSHVHVELRQLEDARKFYGDALGFQPVLDLENVTLLQVEGNTLALTTGHKKEEHRVTELQVENVMDAIERAVAAGAKAGPARIQWTGERTFKVRMGEITDPFGYVWKIYERESLQLKVFKVWLGVCAVGCFYAGVWKPHVEPIMEKWEPQIKPLIRSALSAFKAYTSATEIITESFSKAEDMVKTLDSEASKTFADIQPNMDPSSSSNPYNFQ